MLTPRSPPSLTNGIAARLLKLAQGRAAQRDCAFWWLSELGKIKHTGLRPLARVQRAAMSEFIARSDRGDGMASRMKSGSLPDVCRKGL